MPARSHGDGGAVTGVRGQGVARAAAAHRGGQGESVWAALRSGCRKLHACSRMSKLMFKSAYKREGGNKWGGWLGCWSFGPGRGIERKNRVSNLFKILNICSVALPILKSQNRFSSFQFILCTILDCLVMWPSLLVKS
jgi:hypothetical protein